MRSGQSRKIDRWDLIYQYEDIEDDEESRQWRIAEVQRQRAIPWLEWQKPWPRLSDHVNIRSVRAYQGWESREHPVTHADALEEEISRITITFNALASLDKVPYTDDGIEMIRQAMLAQPGVLDVTIRDRGMGALDVDAVLDNAINVVNIQGTIEV